MLQPSHENFKEQSKSQKELDILIEEELMEESNLEPEKWVKKYGRKFRDDIVEKHPELIEFYRSKPKKAKEEIKKILYGIENIK